MAKLTRKRASGGDGSQRRVLDDKTIQNDDSLSGDENIEGGLTMKGTRPRRQVTAQGTTYPANSGRISRDETEETPLLETRSRTQKIKLALNSHSGDKIDRGSILEANNSQQNMTLENVPRRSRNPIPHSLDEANAADVMLVKMKEKGRSVRNLSGLYSTLQFESRDISPEQLTQSTPHAS